MPAPQSYGRLLGRNVSAARGRLQLTQTSVAARMQALGFDWHQQTAANVEKDKRRLTAEELLALSYSLETSISALERPTEDDEGFVEFPSGATVAAASVRRSAIGQRDAAIEWNGNVPVFNDPVMEELAAQGIVSRVRVSASTGEARRWDKGTGQWVKAEEDPP